MSISIKTKIPKNQRIRALDFKFLTSQKKERLIFLNQKLKWDYVSFIKSNKTFRITALGANGSGKTEFCKKLLNHYQKYKKGRVFVCDTKHEFDHIKAFSKLDYETSKTFIRKISRLKLNGVLYEDPKDIAEFVACLSLEFTPALCYIEELVEIIDKNAHLPITHKNIYKVLQQGRGLGISMVVATQQVSQLNLAFLRQASDIFFFKMRNEECRKIEKLMSLTPNTISFGKDDLYSFYHITQLDEPTFYDKISLEDKRKTKSVESIKENSEYINTERINPNKEYHHLTQRRKSEFQKESYKTVPLSNTDYSGAKFKKENEKILAVVGKLITNDKWKIQKILVPREV